MSDEDFITRAYASLSQQGRKFVHRPGQESLSRHVLQTADENGVLIAEAPTGTGKTIGYLIGALAAREHTGLPIVIATATVALQNQIIQHDIPRMVAAGLVHRNDVALVKGRNRYFCPRYAEAIASPAKVQTDMFADEPAAATIEVKEVSQLLRGWQEGWWDGDSDHWSGTLPSEFAQVSSKSETCSGKHCAYFDRCQFYIDRAKAATCSVLVANHSLVMADLKMRSEELDGLFPFERYLLVIDEGHKLPDNAAEAASHAISLGEQDGWLNELDEFIDELFKLNSLSTTLAELPVSGSSLRAERHLEALARVHGACEEEKISDGKWHRYADGCPSGKLRMAVEHAHGLADNLVQALTEINSRLSKLAGKGEDVNPHMVSLLGRGSTFKARAEKLQKGLFAFISEQHPVVWVSRYQGQYTLCARPMEGSEVLEDLLWSARMPTVVVSATLRAFGSFDRYVEKTGVPAHAKYLVLDYVLPYSNSELILTRSLTKGPGDEGYEQAMAQELVNRINPAEGSLVIFTAKSTMRKVYALLPKALMQATLMQFTKSTAELIELHKRRIDEGSGSVLFGVDTFSEGLDLPGRYCTHVVITKLPFSFPDSPLEEAREARDPKGYFKNSVLPEAAIKLIQSAGRLVRRETDQGKITVLDQRVRTKTYGKKLRDSLPPFKEVREPYKET